MAGEREDRPPSVARTDFSALPGLHLSAIGVVSPWADRTDSIGHLCRHAGAPPPPPDSSGHDLLPSLAAGSVQGLRIVIPIRCEGRDVREGAVRPALSRTGTIACVLEPARTHDSTALPVAAPEGIHKAGEVVRSAGIYRRA